jgi:acetyltransferase-like isoleucine patch superfamily enzyme
MKKSNPKMTLAPSETPPGTDDADVPIIDRLRQTSSYRQYQDLFVGNRSLFGLLAYEFIFGIIGVLPGATGYFGRKKLYPKMLGEVGPTVLFGRSMIVRCPGRIAIGENVTFDDGVVLDAKGSRSNGIRLGSNIWIGRHTILTSLNAEIKMGDHVSIGPFCNFSSHSIIDIGSHVSISPYSSFAASSKDVSDSSVPMLKQKRTSRGIKVGNNVWIGSHAVVLDGVEIGDDVLVGAGAVVTKSIPPGTVAGGVPAKVLKER